MHVALIGAEVEENLAIRYLFGALERAGHRVTLIVFNEPEEMARAARALCASGAEIAGLSMVFTWRAREFAELAKKARELGYQGHIVAGGHFAAFHPEELLGEVSAIDSVALGEGEGIMTDLARSFPALAAVPGLIWRDGERLVRNAPAVKPPDLDSLAPPPRKQPFDELLGLPITNILSSRGCLHRCAFCSISAWHRLCGGERYRLRRPEAVAEEMAGLYQQGVRIFNFHDDNFFLPDKQQMLARLDELSDALERRAVGQIAYAVKSPPESVDEEVFARLRSMGLFRVFVGIEAGTEQSLRQLGRRQSPSQNERALAVINRLDVHGCFNLLVLNPDSTLEDLADNVRFLRRNPQNPMNFCRTEVYAGTPLERRLRKAGRLIGDFWGLSYVIADPRAQAAFEVIAEAFESRNYGEHALHHRAMHVDYEHQLLSDFYGTDDRLRSQVKRYVAEVNRNTCDHLDEIVRELGPGVPPGLEALTERMKWRIEADNRRLMRPGDALLAAIRRRAAGQLPVASSVLTKAATAAGLAAALALTAACDGDRVPHPEMAPQPTDVPRPEMAPQPTDVPRPELVPPLPSADAGAAADRDAGPDAGADAAAKQPPLGDAKLIEPPFAHQMLPYIASRVLPPQEIEIELWFDDAGKVENVILRRAQLTEPVEQAIKQRLRVWRVADPAARSRSFVLVYSPAQLTAARLRSRPPEPEMVPRPEMAPRPPVPLPEMAPRPTPKPIKKQ